MARSLDAGVFRRCPAISVWSGQSPSHDLGQAIRETRETYDNWHVDQRNQKGLNGLLDAFAHSRDGLVWPIDESSIGLEVGVMGQLVDVWRGEGETSSVVVASSLDRLDLLNGLLVADRPMVRHVLFDRSHFFRVRGSVSVMPLEGIIGAVAHVLSSPETVIVDHIPGASLSRELLYDRGDVIEETLAQGPVQWAQWKMKHEAQNDSDRDGHRRSI
jgi:hypothetical protein